MDNENKNNDLDVKENNLDQQVDFNIDESVGGDQFTNKAKNTKNSFINVLSDFNIRDYLTFILFMGFTALILVFSFGIFASLSLITILTRMFVAFFMFGFLSVIISVIVKTFIPEIFSLDDSEQKIKNNYDDIGDNVDFVADDIIDDFDQDKDDMNFNEKDFDLNFGGDNIEMSSNSLSQKYNVTDDPALLAKGVRTVLDQDRNN